MEPSWISIVPPLLAVVLASVIAVALAMDESADAFCAPTALQRVPSLGWILGLLATLQLLLGALVLHRRRMEEG